jgi:starvation-inducible outer membrane lipoprotein
MSQRDALRSKTVGAPKNFRSKVVTVDGDDFEVRQLSVRGRLDVYNRSTKNGILDPLQFQIWAVIATCYVPGTAEKVFDDTDYDLLVDQPTGSFVDKLSEAAIEMLGTEAKPTNDSAETQT